MNKAEKTLEENKEELINMIKDIDDLDFIIYAKKVFLHSLFLRFGKK